MKKRDNLTRSMFIVTLCILASRVLGLGRDIVFASTWGTGYAMDAFIVAFTFPNLLRALFGEGAFSAAFVPIFNEGMKSDGKQASFRSASDVFAVLAFTLTILIFLGWVLIACLQGFFSEPLELLTAKLFPIILVYAIFICLTGAMAGMLNSLNSFLLPALSPIILNLIFIVCALFIAPQVSNIPEKSIYALAWSVPVAGVLQFLVQYWGCYRNGFRFNWRVNLRNPQIKQIIFLLVPALIGISVTQINIVIDRLLATSLGSNAVSSLYYSQRLVYLPVGIFAVAMSTVCLPAMSRAWLINDKQKMRSTLANSLNQLLFLTLPATALLAICGRPIIELLFQHGDFSANSTKDTLLALTYYLPAIPAFSCAKLAVTPYYASKDTKTPVKIAIVCMVINLILNLILMRYLRQGGLALASTISAYVNITLLLLLLKKRLGRLGFSNIKLDFMKSLFATIVAAIVCYLFLQQFPNEEIITFASKATRVFVPLSGGAFAYFVISLLSKNHNLQQFTTIIRRK